MVASYREYASPMGLKLDDGGWTVDFLHWSPGQSVEWRGMATLGALATLHTHGRIELPR